MRRIMAIFCICVILIGIFLNTTVFANSYIYADEDKYDVDAYHSEIWERYGILGDRLWIAQSTDDFYSFVNLINATNDDAWLEFGVNLAEEELTKMRYVEILVNLMALMDVNTEDMIANQAKADTLKTLDDYLLDATEILVEGISVSAAFGTGVTAPMKSIASTMDLTWDAAEVTINSIEVLEYVNRVQKNYAAYTAFLTAVAENTDNSTLRSAAETLYSLAGKAFYCKVDAVISQSDATAEYLGKEVFFDTLLLEDMLKDASTLKLSTEDMAIIEQFKTVYDFLGVLEFSQDVAVFISDIVGGFSDCMNRYSEMRALYEIRKALLYEIGQLRKNIYDVNDAEKIGSVCDLLRYVLYVNFRGEYCFHEMVTTDGDIFSIVITKNGKETSYDELFEFRKSKTEEYSQWIDAIIPAIEQYKKDSQGTDNRPNISDTEIDTNQQTYYIGSTRGFSDGVAWVEARQKENGVVVETQWACIDTSGNVLFMLDPNTFEPSSFANGVSLCKTYDSDYEVNAYNIIDKSGNIVFSSTDGSFDAVIAYSDGYFAVYTYTESFREAGYTVFFMNHKGEVTTQIDGLRTKIPELINCGEGVFAEKIRQNADAAVTYRFYDAKTGNEYEVGGISSHKSMSYIFHNGYAVIEGKRMGDIPKLVSTDGQITELKQFGYGSFYDFGPVSDGGFVCTSYYQDKVEWVKFYDISTGTLTRLGNYGERVALNRATGFRFDNGSMLLPLIGADGKNYYTIVDKSGQSLFEPVVCKYADSEGDDRILVKFEDKTVAYNGRGEMIFELPAGQSVDSYQDGVARLVGSDYAISNTYIDLYGKSLFDSDILLFKSKK